MVRAKFKVTSRKLAGWKDDNGGDIIEIVMEPVYSTNPQHENKRFFDATPNGSLTMDIKNKGAADQLELGKEYYVDISEAPPTIDAD